MDVELLPAIARQGPEAVRPVMKESGANVAALQKDGPRRGQNPAAGSLPGAGAGHSDAVA